MNRVPIIAILTPNTLMSMGLRVMLEKMLPFAVFKEYSLFEEIAELGEDGFFHIFVSSQILIENVAFFERCRSRTIALTNGSPNANALQGFHQLNIMQPEEQITSSIKALHGAAHGGDTSSKIESQKNECEKDILTAREIEVVRLLVDGLINKEIAERLNIGITTVITHRKNIFEKLKIRSLAGLTIYAVMKRYIDI